MFLLSYHNNNRSDKLNDILQKAYKSSQFNYNDQFLDKILKQFLTSTPSNSDIDKSFKFKSDNFNYGLSNTERYFATFTRPSAAPFPRLSPTTATAATAAQQSTLVTFPNISCDKLEDGEFVRDPYDCAVFYTCFMGKASKRSKCEDGLSFDNSIKVCNWKSQVTC